MLQWRVDPGSGITAVITGIPPSALQRLVQSVVPRHSATEDEDEEAQDASGELDLYDETTAARVEAAVTSRHSLTIVWENERWDIAMRRGSSLVHWESPLVAASRGEGFLVRSAWSAGDSEGSASNEVITDCNLLRASGAWRCSPVEAQRLIAGALTEALAHLEGTASAAGDLSTASAASVAPPPILLYIHTPRGSFSSADSLEALDFLKLQAGPYIEATRALVAQAQRVKAGGEAWTREEQLAKYARLRKMADDVIHKVAQAQFAKGPRPVDSGAAGQAAGEATGGGGCGCGGGVGHAHGSGTPSPPAPYVLTDLDNAVLSAVAAAEKELGLAGHGTLSHT